jgi:hypothetical protein
MTKSLTYVEIDIPAFAPTMSPPEEVTYRFTFDTSYLPNTIDAIPNLRSVEFSPAVLSLGQDLGTRSTVTVTLKDHRHSWNGEAVSSGTIWGKFRARYGLKLRGYSLRVIRGTLGDSIEAMETRHYVIDATDGPASNGDYKFIGKDVLKLADGDRAQAPVLNTGRLTADIEEADRSLALVPSGIGDEEYDGEGIVAIGGSEIVRFYRDEFTMALLHFEAADISVAFEDSAYVARTITVTGNAQHDISQFKFGTSSLLCDGTGDKIALDGSSDFVFGTGDFTVEFFLRINATGVLYELYDARNTATQLALDIFKTSAANQLRVFINGANRISGGTGLTTGQWYHVALARSGTSMRLFLNGTQEGSTYTASDNLVGFGPNIGAAFDNSGSLNGWIDELRITKGLARYTANFTAPSAAFTLEGIGDTMRLSERGLMGTTASSHSAGDRVQEVLQYDSEDVADIIYDLLVNYAAVDPAFIALANWQSETATYLGSLYGANIADPTSVAKLISELIEQAGLVIWWDDISQQIKLQVLREIATNAFTYDPDLILEKSIEVKEQPEKRISQIYTYFAQINPLVNLDQLENFASVALEVDEDAEEEYGSPAIKKIFSRWIPLGGLTVAQTVNAIQLARFRDPPRRINFDVMRYVGTDPQLGGGYQCESWLFQDETGAATSVPIQITSLNPRAERFEVEAEEVLFDSDFSPGSPDVRNLVLDVNTIDVNMRDMHDDIYPAPTSGLTVNCTVNEGVIVGSSSTSTPALDVGDWPAGVTLNLFVRGRIQGRGGDGSNGVSGSATAGGAGGTALYTRENITVDLSTGDAEIWGGGGGGAGQGGGVNADGGGGGAGQLPGNGGAGYVPGAGVAGQGGTTEAGGIGGFSGSAQAGDGGGPGLAGETVVAAGGAAGVAIDGVSQVTKVSTGDIRGSEIN